MEWALGGALILYVTVGFVVLFRQMRRRGGLPRLTGGLGGDLWPFVAVAALWPLYLRDKEPSPRAESEERCLLCHRPLPTGAKKCPECGWTWQ